MSQIVLFSWIDYVLFSSMLCFSALIGIYFGCRRTKVKIKDEYLLGGKTLKILPVAASLIASNVSGILLMAVPADVYQFGANIIWSSVAIVISVIVFLYLYMPVLLKPEYNTIFEYLEFRFNRKIRILSSVFFVFQILLNNPILVFIPTLAFAQVSGFPIHAISISVCTICIFYTTIGGLKAVVWTDTLQTFAMYLGFLLVFGKGVAIIGGFGNIWNTSIKGDRLDILRFNLDITDRETVWSVVIGYTGICLNNLASSQVTMQRLMAVPSYNHAKTIIWIFLVGMVITHTITSVMGLLIYTHYSECDPVTTQQILRYDQILPFYVLDIARSLPGLPGLFIAGIFSAALSSLSSNLNTLSGVIYADFLTPYVCIKEKNKDTVLKAIVITCGVLCIISVFAVEQLGGLIPLSASFVAITGGPLLGLFTLGVAVPRANSKNSLIGGIAGVVFVTWITLGNYYYKQIGAITDIPKPASVTNCPVWSNISTIPEAFETQEQPFVLYRINFWYYTIIGCGTTVVVGYITSLFTYDKNSSKVEAKLIAPLLHFLLPTSITKNTDFELVTPLNSIEQKLSDTRTL